LILIFPFDKDSFWLGWTDEAQEGNYTNVNTGEMLNKALSENLYFAGQPNGRDSENCLMYWGDKKGWFDTGCQEKLDSFCHLKAIPIFKVRGEHIVWVNSLKR
jgi:hypothetical protein